MKSDPYAPIREQMNETPQAWRSLEHQALAPDLLEEQNREFKSPPAEASGFDRREAIKLAGAALALGPLAGCKVLRRPEEEILPFTKMPEQLIPGVRQNYATAMPRGDGALGLVVESNTGRPTTIEGNPNHPASLGSTDVWGQSEILKLYDPDRARVPHNAGKPSTWEAFDKFSTEHFAKVISSQGQGLAFLVDEADSPTFERLLGVMAAKLPQAKLYRWDPVAPDQGRQGTTIAFGEGARAHTDFEKAKIVFALDSNFLIEGPDHVKVARQFGKRRTVLTPQEAGNMNRLYVAEGVFSTSGANADHRLRIASGQGGALLGQVARALGIDLGEIGAALPAATVEGSEKFVAALAKDLAANKGAAVIVVGERQPAAVHALAHAINAALESPTVLTRSPPLVAAPRGFEGLKALTDALNANAVQTLVIFESNPLYTAPGGLKFAEAFAKAQTVVHAGVLPEETGAKATWHVPSTHFLEGWGDARGWDGTVSIVQPLILPLHGARAPISILAQLIGYTEKDDRKLVAETWRSVQGQPLQAEKAWRRALHDGVLAGSGWGASKPEVNRAAVATALAGVQVAAPSKGALEVVAYTGHVLDGRLSNVTWLQELPDSMSKLCWDNALMVSPALAKELGIDSQVNRNGYEADVLTLKADGRTLTAPSFVLPGLAKYSIAIARGYGRAAGEVCKGVGVDANAFFADGRGVVQGATLEKAGKTQILCSTQDHFSVPGDPYKQMTFAQMSGDKSKAATLGLGERPLYLQGTTGEFKAKGAKITEKAQAPENLVQLGTPRNRPAKPIQPWDEMLYEGQQWGMVIDLTSCIGCNACAIACVAENNIPSVGREQVLLGRELHWIRVDRYFIGDADDATAGHQPLPCMHCENAPCEAVCPVAATTHDEEGINSMAYNRCIGTRYCNNNCPFKVRRFNYLDFTVTGNLEDFRDKVQNERWKTMKLQRNPDVSVRYRGVMEKCTFCTQRVEEAKIAAKREGKDRKALPDGAVTPACAQACPTQAITFGNINDPQSRVARLKTSDRNYEMLQELNVRPRTTYLSRLKNTNEELA